jgi:hypothetical protein
MKINFYWKLECNMPPRTNSAVEKQTLCNTSLTQHASSVWGSMKGCLHNITFPFHYNKQCSNPHRSISACSDKSPQEVRVHSQGSSQGICDRTSGAGTGFSPNTSVSPVSTIPLMLHVHNHLNTTYIKRTRGRSLKTFIQNNVASHIGEQWTEICSEAISVFKC